MSRISLDSLGANSCSKKTMSVISVIGLGFIWFLWSCSSVQAKLIGLFLIWYIPPRALMDDLGLAIWKRWPGRRFFARLGVFAALFGFLMVYGPFHDRDHLLGPFIGSAILVLLALCVSSLESYLKAAPPPKKDEDNGDPPTPWPYLEKSILKQEEDLSKMKKIRKRVIRCRKLRR